MNKTIKDLYLSNNEKSSDKWNTYVEIYDRLFAPFKEKNINLLEIGVQNGGSLEIWSKYFHNFKKIVGVDINPKCKKLEYSENIHVIVGDANDVVEEIVSIFNDGIDIIIDDGSHFSGDIIKSFCNLFPKLDNDGLYVIEDLHCSYWEQFDGGLYNPLSSMNFLKALSDIVNVQHFENDKVLTEFFDNYNVVLDLDDLKSIHSITFFNSICVIEKKQVEHNKISYRYFSHGEELVVTNSGYDSGFVGLKQTDSNWDNDGYSPSFKYWSLKNELKVMTKNNCELIGELEKINNSVFGKLYNIFCNKGR